MRRGTLLLLGCLLLLALLVFRFSPQDLPPRTNTGASVDRTPVCPWREPRRDLLALFPGATNYVVDTRILSGSMVPIQRRLGRAMTVDENPLRIFRVQQQERWIGSALVRRAKGEHGGIEIVIGVETNGTVRGVLIQSQREPEPIAQVITNAPFLRSFIGKNAASSLRLGEDLPEVRAEARSCGQVVADGVRSQLIVLSFAERSAELRESRLPSNH
jgi:hypothetical protein